jgi:ppGpp synthetase/RelA/SpoT-type nucleotidyltranferase
MNVIDVFLQQYTKEYDYFYELAKRVANICETLLQRNGIHAVVTYRAKRPDSLKEKLIKRNEIKKYECIEQIYQDIADLAGVRIANYFPGDRGEIARLIEAEFITEKTKYFPNPEITTPFMLSYKRRFAGYDAIHFRIRIKDVRLEDSKKRFSQSLVEIQIASALMHAWAEVEHDLAYKPKVGGLSEEEHRILDELNGMVLSGEIALERLQKAFNQRISKIQHSFNNHYELAALIREKIVMESPYNSYMGRADILYRFLQKINKDKPKDICRYIEIAGNIKQSRTIVRKMVDLILEDYPQYYNSYIEAKYEVYGITAHLAEESLSFIQRDNAKLNQFVDLWGELQVEAKKLYDALEIIECQDSEKLDVYECRLIVMLQLLGIADEQIEEARYLYNLRNNVLFAAELPDEEILTNGCRYLKKLISSLRVCATAEIRSAYKNIDKDKLEL